MCQFRGLAHKDLPAWRRAERATLELGMISRFEDAKEHEDLGVPGRLVTTERCLLRDFADAGARLNWLFDVDEAEL
jgi:hypothetical protein